MMEVVVASVFTVTTELDGLGFSVLFSIAVEDVDVETSVICFVEVCKDVVDFSSAFSVVVKVGKESSVVILAVVEGVIVVLSIVGTVEL